jgi:hypothetical protein
MKYLPYLSGLVLISLTASQASASIRPKSPIRAWGRAAIAAAALPFLGHQDAPAQDIRPSWTRSPYADTRLVGEYDVLIEREKFLQGALTRLASAFHPELAQFSSIQAMRIVNYVPHWDPKVERKRLARLAEAVRVIEPERLRLRDVPSLSEFDAAYEILHQQEPIADDLKSLKPSDLAKRIVARWQNLQLEQEKVTQRINEIDRDQRARANANRPVVSYASSVAAPAAAPGSSVRELTWEEVPPGTVLRSSVRDEHGYLIYFKGEFRRPPKDWVPGTVR